jgi:hypothetical protein
VSLDVHENWAISGKKKSDSVLAITCLGNECRI